MRPAILLLLPLLLSGLPRPARGQLSPEARLSVMSAFVWRGLTVVNRPVIQPEATVSAGPVSFGLWANVEPVRYRGSDDLSVLAGRRAPGVTEVDPSVEVSHGFGKTEVAAGAIGYAFTHAAGYETAPNTLELYGRVALAGALPLEVSGYYDVHAVRGLYLEAGVERPLPRWSALLLGARLGASLGEATGPQSAYYERDGITHLALSAVLPITAGPLQLSPEANLVLCADEATRVTSATHTHPAKLWVGASVAWPGREE